VSPDVHEYNVGPYPACNGHGLIAGGRFSDYLDLSVDPEHLAQTDAYQALVVGDHNADRRPSCGARRKGDLKLVAQALARGTAVGLPAHVVDAVRFRDNIASTVAEVTVDQIGGDGKSQPARRIRLTPASAIKPRPVRWAWTDRIPAGELTLTPGRGGVGNRLPHGWRRARSRR
jgi:hypothetical protein